MELNSPFREIQIQVYHRQCVTKSDDIYLHREIRVMKQLTSPNIAALVDFFEDKDQYVVVHEWLPYENLFDRILLKTNGSGDPNLGIDEKSAKMLVLNLLLAVKDCHDQGIIHRSIHPQAIVMLTPDNDHSIKLSAFSQAVFLTDHDVNYLPLSEGSFLLQYLPPEVLADEGHKLTPAFDMWCVGVLTYYICYCMVPFALDSQPLDLEEIDEFVRLLPDIASRFSRDGMVFIAQLLNVKQSLRLTVDEALAHPWVSILALKCFYFFTSCASLTSSCIVLWFDIYYVFYSYERS